QHSGSGMNALRIISRSRASDGGRKCVRKRDRADFPPVLKSGHTMRLRCQCGAYGVSEATDFADARRRQNSRPPSKPAPAASLSQEEAIPENVTPVRCG